MIAHEASMICCSDFSMSSVQHVINLLADSDCWYMGANIPLNRCNIYTKTFPAHDRTQEAHFITRHASQLARDSVLARPSSIGKPFRRNNLVVQRTQVQAQLRPLRHVVRKRNGATIAPLALPDRDVLVESRRALDGRLVDLLVLVDGVRGAVAGEGALYGPLAGRAAAVAVLDVVLDERAGAPAVERREDGAGGGGGRAGEGDRSA